MLGDACRLALAAWEPVRGLAARRDGWRTEGAGPARRRALRRTADALERALVGLVLCVRQARARWLKKKIPCAGEKFWGPPTRTRQSS